MPKSPQLKAWRDVLPIHPAADLFPAMSETELRELGEDIKANGLRSPIILWSPGDQLEKDAKEFLLDGRNRLDAMELVGMETVNKDGKLSGFLGGSNSLRGMHRAPIVRLHEFVAGHTLSLGGRTAGLGKEFRKPDTDPYVFVLSANIHRRHLTAEQKRELIAKLIKQTPNKSDRRIAQQTKTSPTTVGKIRKEAEATGDVSKLDTRTDTKGRKQPSTKPKKPSKPASPAKTDPIGSSPVRHSEVPATSVSPESRPQSVSARDIALEGFSAHSMELVRLTRNKSARRFAKTSTPDEGIRQLAKLFSDLINIRNEKVVDRICGSAEVSTEQRRAEHAALDGATS
jgi:hypothetical protein